MNCGGVADRIFDNLCHCATHCQLRNVMILLPSCTISHTSDSSPDFIESCLSKWTMTHLDYLLCLQIFVSFIFYYFPLLTHSHY